ncbi:MAG: beta-aspartyl-peptidase [Candidatus Poseidoniales archaeon]|nr:MAG: beta-aspartyl-peptidase [Candidatus Poseidoniales archaeon]
MVVLAVHGGAGGDGPWRGMTDADPQRLACMRALLNDIGERLRAGTLDALEAVTLAVEAMENEPLFNAGKGSVLDASGQVTMDASIMCGQDQAAGSVIGIRTSRHPVRVARRLLDAGWPVMLYGEAADAYGEEHGVEQVESTWLVTELRSAQWAKWKEQRLRPGATDEEDALLDHDGEQDGWGTVGAVALDASGRLAAATSTGGMTGKPLGRVGDTPLIGAGTWADQCIAVSCTGIGEAFIRTAAAHQTAVLHREMKIEQAALAVLDEVEPFGGRGGMIAVDREGNVTLPFQTMLMYRGMYCDGSVRLGIGPELMD